MNGGSILFDRFGAICRELGLAPWQTATLFGSLPCGSQRVLWDNLAAHIATSRGTA